MRRDKAWWSGRWGDYCTDDAFLEHGDGFVLEDDGSKNVRGNETRNYTDYRQPGITSPYQNLQTNATKNFIKCEVRGEYFPACEDTVDLMQPLVSCTRLRLSQRVKASGFGVPFPPACAGPCAPIPSAHYVLNGTLNAAHILPREHTTHTSRLNADSHEHVKAWPGGRDLKRQRS